MGWFKNLTRKIPKVIFVKKLPWPFPEEIGDFATGPLNFIEKDQKDNKSLRAHVETHRQQWEKSKKIFWIRYLIPKYRLKYEIEAYAAQAHYAVSSFERQKKFKSYAERLSTDYFLKISAKNAEKKLKEYYIKKYL